MLSPRKFHYAHHIELFATIIVIFHKPEVIQSEVYTNSSITRYAQIRELYPKISSFGEARFWRMARNDNFKEHPCKRECVTNQQMTCYYYMVVHYDETMGPGCQEYLNPKNRYKVGTREYVNYFSIKNNATLYDDCKYADGVKSEIMVVNGQLPGLSIETCVGDTIVADIINSMHEMTTIHWHGMHQINTPHMDGVPYITQYPIEPGQAFRYRFEADHVGTHWWHSHTEHQRAFGLAGPLVVRQSRKENVHAHLYDFDYSEHTIMLQDWISDFDETVPKSILINGLGRNVNEATNVQPTLYSKFEVARGGRYRFRVIFNGNTNCPVSLTIDQHNLLVIASDGNDIEPVLVQNITFHGGERHDFVLEAKRSVGNYWIRVKGHTFCEINQLHQEAILHYMGADRLKMPKGAAPSYAYESPDAITFNSIDVSPSKNRKRFSFKDVKALLPKPLPNVKPFRTYYTSMNIVMRGGSFLFQMDDITFTMPKVSLLQTRNLGIGKMFCNRTQQSGLGFNCLKRHCRCTNIIQMPAFKHVEMVLSGRSNRAHPIHLHGFTFQVVGMGVLGEDKIDKIEEIDRKKPLPRRTIKAPLKDTIQVPGYGYTIIRFYTNNPGYWITHCHISTHSENGMAAILRVGDDIQMKMCPVSNCGLCNSVV